MLPCYIRQSNLRLNNSLEKLATLRLRRRMPFERSVFFSKVTKHSDGGMSRTERRLFERKKRNKAKKNTNMITVSSSEKITSTLLKSQHFRYLLVPRLPGRPQQFSCSLLIALCYRLPIFLVLSYVLTDENTSPYIIQGSLGPSMLPTIQFAGDIWLVETGAWERILRRIFRRQDEGDFSASTSYKVGDLLIWEDLKTGKRSCKRLIGIEGDKVKKDGEYGDMYRYRSDFGIIWPKNKERHINHGFDSSTRWDTVLENIALQCYDKQENEAETPCTLVVPDNYVWLEGDCPLFSMDSRQFGPIHVSRIRGRLVFRLWPWRRNDVSNDKKNAHLSSCWIRRNRPVPYHSIEAYIGKRFDFYRLSSTNQNHNNVKRDVGESK